MCYLLVIMASPVVVTNMPNTPQWVYCITGGQKHRTNILSLVITSIVDIPVTDYLTISSRNIDSLRLHTQKYIHSTKSQNLSLPVLLLFLFLAFQYLLCSCTINPWNLHSSKPYLLNHSGIGLPAFSYHCPVMQFLFVHWIVFTFVLHDFN